MDASSHIRRTSKHRRYQAAKFPDVANNVVLDRRQAGFGFLPPGIETRLPPSFGITDLFPPVLPTGVNTGIISRSDIPSVSTSASTSASISTTQANVPTVLSTTSSTASSTSTSLTSPSIATTRPEVVVTSTDRPATVVVTNSISRSSTTAAAAASATSSIEPTSGMGTGVIVGGIGAGIVAIAAIAVAVAFFIRRSRKRHEDEGTFDPADFRRSAMLMPEPPTHEDTIAHGFNPRPPTMIERRLAVSNQGYSNSSHGGGYEGSVHGGYVGDNQAGYGAHYGAHAQFQSLAPRQVLNPITPISTDTANPFFTPAPYTQSPFSPAISPISPRNPFEPQYNEKGEPIVTPVLTRQASSASGHSKVSRKPSIARSVTLTLKRQPSVPRIDVVPFNDADTQRQSVFASDYVDLSRSSVSPFQAAQYAEISRRLNSEVPGGLTTPEVKRYISGTDRDLPPIPPKDEDADNDHSPFSDAHRPRSPQRSSPTSSDSKDNRQSSDSFSEALDFPAPPSQAHTAPSRYRIGSMPPTLPEIHVESRVSVASYSNFEFEPARHGLGQGQSPMGSGYPSGITAGASPFLNRFPVTPSPLNSSFMIPSPVSDTTSKGFDLVDAEKENRFVAPSPLSQSNASGSIENTHNNNKNDKNGADAGGGQQRPNTVYSMYDPEDAYGGI